MGAEINANAYCGSRPTFDRIIDFIFRYQWFNTPVVPTKEIKDTMYELTRGIIDQVIGLYQFMNIDYILATTKRKNRPVDSNYIREVSEKHFSGMAEILRRAEYDPAAEAERGKLMKSANKAISDMLDKNQQANELKAYEAAAGNSISDIRDSVVAALTLTTAYADQTIRNAFNAIVESPQGKAALEAGDRKALTRLTSDRLSKSVPNLKRGARKSPAEPKVITSFLDSAEPDPLAG